MTEDQPGMSITTQELAVETTKLQVRFPAGFALEDINLAVPRGSFYLLVGPNGAGKTTIFKCILGLLTPDAGAALVCGQRSGLDGRARALIGFVPESGLSAYGWMRVQDLAEHHALYYPTWDGDYQASLEQKLEIKSRQRVGTLSKGETRRVQLMLALSPRPPVLLLDEPTDGLDPSARRVVFQVLAQHIADGSSTVIVSTHLVYEMERFADRVALLKNGRLLGQFSSAEVLESVHKYTFSKPIGQNVLSELRFANVPGQPLEFMICGSRNDVAEALRRAGAPAAAITPSTLDEAAVTLLDT